MLAFIATITGYLASILLAISLVVTNDIKFRWLNTLGCLSFIAYGILINAFPIILTNTTLLLINVFYLVKIYRTQEDFDVIEFKGEEKLMAKFLTFYRKDINTYFPNFDMARSQANLRFVVIRDIVVANVFVADLLPNGTAVVELNFTVPRYRDFKVGTYLFEKDKQFLASKGVKKIRYEKVANKAHAKFLQIMGFVKMDGGYVKEL